MSIWTGVLSVLGLALSVLPFFCLGTAQLSHARFPIGWWALWDPGCCCKLHGGLHPKKLDVTGGLYLAEAFRHV